MGNDVPVGRSAPGRAGSAVKRGDVPEQGWGRQAPWGVNGCVGRHHGAAQTRTTSHNEVSMDFVFLCHAPEDAAVAYDLGVHLERNCPCDIRYNECGTGAAHDLLEAVEQSMAARAIIVLLSPASVLERWARSRWEPVLLEQPAEAGTGVACVELRDCRFPELLRRRDFFGASLAGRRALKRWLLEKFPSVVEMPEGAVPAAPEAVLEDLRRRLADEPGSITGVPLETALAFAHASVADFEGVIWLDCTRRSRAGAAGDLCAALGLAVSGVIEENEEELRRVLASRRLLVVFDNLTGDPIAREGKCSMLATARRAGTEPRPFAEVAEAFSRWTIDDRRCLALLRDLADAINGNRDWPGVRTLAFDAVGLLSRRRERTGELLELLEVLIARAWDEGDDEALRKFEWERGWIPTRANQSRPHSPPPAPGDQLSLELLFG